MREATVDRAAITANVRRLREIAGTQHTMVVVKADGYGHGAIAAARAALAGGADWLGVADIAEALALRSAGIRAPTLAWLHGNTARFAEAARAEIDLGISSLDHLEKAAATDIRGAAAVQLKLDTGLSRNGAAPAEWRALFRRAAELERAHRVRVRGVFSHLANASAADDRAALTAFDAAIREARAAGLAPQLLHLASTAAAIRLPEARFNLVRLGIGSYGLSPFPDQRSADLGLLPAMTVRSTVAAVRRVPAGTGVSYGYTWRAEHATTLALVPFGYADGAPRAASTAARVLVGARLRPVRGRIAMDQMVVDVGDDPVAVGDAVTLFGSGAAGEPTATDWADWAGTINYEIVTRIGQRVTRVYP